MHTLSTRHCHPENGEFISSKYVQLAIDFRAEEEVAQAALSVLWKSNYKALVYYADQIVNSTLISEDVVTETFVKLWARRLNFDNVLSIRSFLYVTVRNACYDHLRSQNIHARIHNEILKTSDYIQEISQEDYDRMYNEYIQLVNKQVNELPERCRVIFNLYFHEQLSTCEIAQALNISEQTVRNQKTKAVAMLKAGLLKKGMLPVTMLLNFFAVLCAIDD